MTFIMPGSNGVKEALNDGTLPADYYALAEQHASQFGPDVLTLQARLENIKEVDEVAPILNGPGGAQGVIVAEPKARLAGETDLEFYRRKQNVVAVRHVSGDRLWRSSRSSRRGTSRARPSSEVRRQGGRAAQPGYPPADPRPDPARHAAIPTGSTGRSGRR